MVARDGIEPPTPAFSGPRSTTELPGLRAHDTPKAAEYLVNLDPAKWDENWKMTAGDQTWINDSRYRIFRTWVLDHLIHHRAQLGRDLRSLGVPIPGTYGPSADES